MTQTKYTIYGVIRERKWATDPAATGHEYLQPVELVAFATALAEALETDADRLRAEIQRMYRQCPYCNYEEKEGGGWSCLPCKFHLGCEAIGIDRDEDGKFYAKCPYCGTPE